MKENAHNATKVTDFLLNGITCENLVTIFQAFDKLRYSQFVSFIICILFSNLSDSIETIAIEDSVPLEASYGQNHFLAAGKRSVVIATSAIICEQFSARGDGAEAGHDVTCHKFVTRCHASVTL